MAVAIASITIPVSPSYGGETQFGFWMSETPPANPFHGMPWYHTGTGALHVYFVDQDSTTQWLRVN